MLLVWCTWLAGAGAAEKISITVSPRVAHAPGHIRVRAVVERNQKNRGLQVVAESADFYRSSTVPLEGERGALITVIQLDGLPLGDYRVTANLLGAGDEVRATVRRIVLVASPEMVLPH